MSLYEVIAIIVSSFGLIISIISIFISLNAHKISQGQIELNIHQLINQTKKDVSEITRIISETCSETEEEKKQAFLGELNVAIERNINAYEEACAKYLDNKVDKKRFEKNYHIEIRQLVEDKNNKERFDSTTSPYKCILKVYELWNNHEK